MKSSSSKYLNEQQWNADFLVLNELYRSDTATNRTESGKWSFFVTLAECRRKYQGITGSQMIESETLWFAPCCKDGLPARPTQKNKSCAQLYRSNVKADISAWYTKTLASTLYHSCSGEREQYRQMCRLSRNVFLSMTLQYGTYCNQNIRTRQTTTLVIMCSVMSIQLICWPKQQD